MRLLFLLWNSIWIVHGLSSVIVFEGKWSIFEQQRYNWDNSAPFSFTDFHKPSVSYQYFYFFYDPHQVILIRAPPNDSVVWLSCSFQTVGSSYYTIAATLRTHWGANTPSASHVGSNRMRVLTVTISKMTMLFTSGGLCVLCAAHRTNLLWCRIQNMWILSWTLEAATVRAAGLRQLPHLSLCSLLLHFHHRGGNQKRKYSYVTAQGKNCCDFSFYASGWENLTCCSSLQSCSLILW